MRDLRGCPGRLSVTQSVASYEVQDGCLKTPFCCFHVNPDLHDVSYSYICNKILSFLRHDFPYCHFDSGRDFDAIFLAA